MMRLVGLKPSHVLGNREIITMNGTRPFEDVVDTSLPDEEVMNKIQQAEERMQRMKVFYICMYIRTCVQSQRSIMIF